MKYISATERYLNASKGARKIEKAVQERNAKLKKVQEQTKITHKTPTMTYSPLVAPIVNSKLAKYKPEMYITTAKDTEQTAKQKQLLLNSVVNSANKESKTMTPVQLDKMIGPTGVKGALYKMKAGKTLNAPEASEYVSSSKIEGPL
mgnify:CR=1 FL=1